MFDTAYTGPHHPRNMAPPPLWHPKPLWELPPCPYVNRTPKTTFGQQITALLVGLTLFLPRLVLVIFSVLASYVFAKMSVIGWQVEPRPDRPLPRWRYALQKMLVPPMVRLNLFALGFHYIEIRGKPARRTEAPILVCNHQSFLDIWFWLWQLLPVGVSAAENMRFPIMGEIMQSFQTIFVDREQHQSGRDAAQQMRDTLQDPRYPQVLTYPEGNTGNGSCMCGFKQGAFQHGVPVQPVVIQYTSKHLDACWVEPLGMPLPNLAVRLMLQLNNKMVVTYMDPVSPKPSEEPHVFMARVQKQMAECAGVPITQYSFGDTALMFRARKYKIDPKEVLMEMDRATQVYGLGVTECKECMEHFAEGLEHERKSSGNPKLMALKGEGLLVALSIDVQTRHVFKQGKSSDKLQTLLGIFDQTKSGDVSFREFVAGLATPAEIGEKTTSFYNRAITHVQIAV